MRVKDGAQADHRNVWRPPGALTRWEMLSSKVWRVYPFATNISHLAAIALREWLAQQPPFFLHSAQFAESSTRALCTRRAIIGVAKTNTPLESAFSVCRILIPTVRCNMRRINYLKDML